MSGGFTLMEMLVALGILTVGMVSILGLFAFALGIHKEAVDRIHASSAAERIAGELFADLKTQWSEEGLPLSSLLEAEVPDHPGYTYKVDFIDVDEAGREAIAKITISWGGRGARRSVEYPTVFVKEWDFGTRVRKLREKGR
jgi:prepilin-type N-terminal cleavage/methylation domain-containing protein